MSQLARTVRRCLGLGGAGRSLAGPFPHMQFMCEQHLLTILLYDSGYELRRATGSVMFRRFDFGF